MTITSRKKVCVIVKPDLWPWRVQRVFGTSEFGPSRNFKNIFVLFDGRSDKIMKL